MAISIVLDKKAINSKINEKSVNSDNIVLFSGGMASFEACRRVVDSTDKTKVRIWFFDTKIEDDDTYRFIDDCENFFKINIEILADGRNMWQVFRDERFIGNSQKCVCTRVLKRQLLERTLKQRYPNKNVILNFGLEHSEQLRIDKVRVGWEKKGIGVSFPLLDYLIDRPINLRGEVLSNGLVPPRFYSMGFKHNNCGGGCVRAGINQWVLLWKLFPERFLWHEREEQITREFLNKDVSILKDRRYKTTAPLTLRNLRRRIEGV